MTNYREIVPKKFWHDSEPTPVAFTVGSLIEVLKELPPELTITTGFNDGTMVCLYNIDRDNMHIELVELEPEDEEDWPDEDEE